MSFTFQKTRSTNNSRVKEEISTVFKHRADSKQWRGGGVGGGIILFHIHVKVQ